MEKQDNESSIKALKSIPQEFSTKRNSKPKIFTLNSLKNNKASC